MMQIPVPRCGRVLLHNISLIQARTHSISPSFAACFRSTPTSFEKWKSKWKNSLELGRPKPSKTYVQYKTRQKRADAKKALNDLLSRGVCSKFTLEGEFLRKPGRNSCDGHGPFTVQRENRNKGDRLKYSAFRGSKDRHQKRNKSKRKKDFFSDFDDDPGTNFHATFGNRSYSWSFKSWEESFSQSQTSGFEWREDTKSNRNKWRTASDEESDDEEEPSIIGSNSDRITLGLPVNTQLKIDEVKNAFRLSALQWHPDRHQGPSQALAEEKFKLCVSAYKSLCNALSKV